MNILFIVICLQFIYIVYSDIQNRRERESLELKVMSKSLDDYKFAMGETPEDSTKQEPDPYVEPEDVGVERIVKAKE